MADALDPSALLACLEELPLPAAICKADGTILALSKAFHEITGLSETQRPEWFPTSERNAPDLVTQQRTFRVCVNRCGERAVVGLLEITEQIKMEEALWDHQLRLSKVYSELNVKNQKLTEAIEQIKNREKELEQMNEALEKKVAESAAQLERTLRLKRYLAPDIANSIISDNALNLGTHKRNITIFFAELSDFDDLTAEMESEEVIEVLNEYHKEMTALIFSHGGTLDKFIASKIIGFFGDPIPCNDHAQKAVQMAMAMREKVHELREHWFMATSRVEFRCGIHTGYATVGNVGCSERLDYTAIGKNVGLASQLQQEALPGQILMSRRTYDVVKSDFDCEQLEICVKSGSKPISVYNLRYPKDSPAMATIMYDQPQEPQGIAAGQRLGPYKIMEKLGEGGMGVVYRGFDESLERNVAIKVLNPSLSRDEKFLARFKKEAKSLANLNSPHIAQIYFISESGNMPYFAMEFVDGTTLARHIERSGHVPLRQTLEIVNQIVEALDAALERGIIHRDIKPDNVMLTQNYVVKVTDFGLVKSFVEDSVKTTAGMVLGTPYYMSPEQARGEEVDQRSDIYSLGATMFHMLVGQPPFRGNSALEIFRKHEDHALPTLATLPPEITARTYSIIQRMMAKSRAERFPTYKVLRDELSNC